MKVSTDKCKVLTPQSQNISFEGEPIKNVNEFIFVGSLIPGNASELHRRIGLASCIFERIKRTIWSNTKYQCK